MSKFYFSDFEFLVLCSSKIAVKRFIWQMLWFETTLLDYKKLQDNEDSVLNNYLKSIKYTKNERTMLYGKERSKTHK